MTPTDGTPTDLTGVLSGLRDEISALRIDLASERHDRQEAQRALTVAERNGRITRMVGWLVAVAIVAVGAGWMADRIAAADRRAEQACSTRIESREEIRTSMVAIAVYAAEVAGMDSAETDVLVTGAERIALETLPPPDC